ncbi:hypothetical protein EPK84_11215 (plasmid) [Sinorhizobium fredii]|nr:hypothetical protein EPK84_11215 [Sinorhizobium fredii]
MGETLQRRASFQTHKGRCSTLDCCMFLSLNRLRSKETCSRSHSRRQMADPRDRLGVDRPLEIKSSISPRAIPRSNTSAIEVNRGPTSHYVRRPFRHIHARLLSSAVGVTARAYRRRKSLEKNPLI